MANVTFKGNPMTLVGTEVGDQAPNFQVLANDLSPVSLETYKGEVKLISVVPSIDTGVCDAQTRRFNQDAAGIENAKVLTIALIYHSLKTLCANGLENVVTLSDHRDLSFGEAYGLVMKELRLLARAVFVVDSNDKVVYVEYVAKVQAIKL